MSSETQRQGTHSCQHLGTSPIADRQHSVPHQASGPTKPLKALGAHPLLTPHPPTDSFLGGETRD